MDYARKHRRYGHRDSTMILVDRPSGLRASEVCDLQWHQVELDHGRMHVRRAKNGTPSVHPIRGDEIRALRKLRRENSNEAYVFVTERGGPMTGTDQTNLDVRAADTTPPVGGTVGILKIAHAPSPKNVSKTVCPRKGVAFLWKAFLQKNFRMRCRLVGTLLPIRHVRFDGRYWG